MKCQPVPNVHGIVVTRRWAEAVAVLVDLPDGIPGYRAWRDNPGVLQSPVDLPLRLDDAGASSTTPQGPHQEVIYIEKESGLRPGWSTMRQWEQAW